MGLADSIQNMSNGVTVLIGLGLAGAVYMMSSPDLEKIQKDTQQKEVELKKKATEIQETEKLAGDKTAFEADVNRVSDQLKAAVEFLPTRLNEQEVLAKITNEARTAGVNPKKIDRKNPTTKEFYEELQMDVEMEGSYTQLVLFLSYISKVQRILNIRGMELQFKDYVDEVPILKLKGTLVAYRYLNEKVGAKPEAKAEEKKK